MRKKEIIEFLQENNYRFKEFVSLENEMVNLSIYFGDSPIVIEIDNSSSKIIYGDMFNTRNQTKLAEMILFLGKKDKIIKLLEFLGGENEKK